MTITFPMWFIYLWAAAIVLGFINTVKCLFTTVKGLKKLPENVSELITPTISENLENALIKNVKVELGEKLDDEYIVVKKPVRKAKKEAPENAEVH